MFNKVEEFESTISEFYGAKFAVATDCCTHAIELCLRLAKPKFTICPRNTYISIPMTLVKLNLDWKFHTVHWQKFYFLTNTRIIDAAVLWEENSYISGTFMCLSFQYRKHLSLGRGGMILLDDKRDYEILQTMAYDGRYRNIPWAEQNIETIGYHYYMTPETAELGIEKFKTVKKINPKSWSYRDYPDLSKMKVFSGV